MAYILNLQDFQAKVLLQTITDSATYIKVELKVLEYLLTFWHGNTTPHAPYLFIDDSNLHRVFIINQDKKKIVSFSFQFTIKTVDYDISDSNNHVAQFNFIGERGIVLPQNISDANGILQELENNNSRYCFLDIDDVPEESIHLFEFLLLGEPGYLRYDNDVRGYKPLIHPQHHIDVNFTPNISYKLGLCSGIDLSQLTSFVDNRKIRPTINPITQLPSFHSNRSSKKKRYNKK